MGRRAEVIWSEEAEESLEQFYRFVEKQWSAKVADRFLDLIIEFERSIERNPYCFAAARIHPNLRIGKVHKHVQVVYEIQKDRLFIITLIDNRSEISGQL